MGVAGGEIWEMNPGYFAMCTGAGCCSGIGMRDELGGAVVRGVLGLGIVGVAVLGCQWPGQPRYLLDPPCERTIKTWVDCKCVSSGGGGE